METIHIEAPDELIAHLRGIHQSPDLAARELIVMELYRRGSISSGKAAELLDMERLVFVRYASRLGLPFFEMGEDEWAAERGAAGKLPLSRQVSPSNEGEM